MGVIRKTKSVNSLLSLFEQTNEAICISDLVRRLSNEMNKTTVYRILDRLEDDGTLHSFSGKNGHKWYSKYKNCEHPTDKHAHPHFQCQDCGKTECLPINVSIPYIADYKVKSVSLLLTGTCKECV